MPQTVLPLINPFAHVPEAERERAIHVQFQKEVRWINILGYGKKGKTEFCIDLMRHLKTAYLDLDNGTSLVPGFMGFKAESFEELRTKAGWINSRRVKDSQQQPIKLDLIVVDTLDAMLQLASRYYCEQNNLTSVGEVSYGAGWEDVRVLFERTIDGIMSMCKLLITVTHLKHSALGMDEERLSFFDMNLSGKVKQMVIDRVDANMVFTRAIDTSGQPYARVRIDNTNEGSTQFAGSRDPELYSIETAKDLKAYILRQFTITLPSEEEGILIHSGNIPIPGYAERSFAPARAEIMHRRAAAPDHAPSTDHSSEVAVMDGTPAPGTQSEETFDDLF
jgi:hypothetical protein